MRSIVFSIDDFFVEPFKVMFKSFEINSKLKTDVSIIIVYEVDKLSENNIKVIRQFVNSTKYKNFKFISISESLDINLPFNIGDHVSRATYLRLFLAEVLPREITSVLYLDIDILIVGELKELYDMKIDKPIAAVDHFSAKDSIRIWGLAGGDYFQAGVLIIDLNYIIDNNIIQVFKDVIKNRFEMLKWHDQDVLNIVFENNWERIPVYFNLTSFLLNSLPVELYKSEAKIIHFEGDLKPWKIHVRRPYYNEWRNYYNLIYGEDIFFQFKRCFVLFYNELNNRLRVLFKF